MNTEQVLYTIWTKINLRIGEVTKTILDRLERHDNILPPQISAENPGQIHLTHQCLIGLEAKTGATIYSTTTNSQLPTMVTSQT